MSIESIADEFAGSLLELQVLSREVTELADQFMEVSAGLTSTQYSQFSLILRETRDALGTAKSRCTAVRDRVNTHFVIAITDEGLTEFETITHKFYAGADGFFSPPSPAKHPAEFAALHTWLQTHGHDANAVLFSKKDLTVLCKQMMKEGKPLPPNVKQHTIPSVRIRLKK